jgi:hypothetical protein
VSQSRGTRRTVRKVRDYEAGAPSTVTSCSYGVMQVLRSAPISAAPCGLTKGACSIVRASPCADGVWLREYR